MLIGLRRAGPCPTQLLKYSSEVISPVLSGILNTSVSLGVYPKKLKISKIIPIFKADDETDTSNYRPISLLSNFNRIFEKLMYDRMRDFIEKHSLLYLSQYGFRQAYLTQHAILDMVETIQTNMVCPSLIILCLHCHFRRWHGPL